MWNLMKMELKSSRFKWANIIVILIIVFSIISVYIFKSAEYNYINELYFTSLIFAMYYLGNNQIDQYDLIMNSIPVSKKHIVVSNYLVTLLGFGLSSIYTILYFWALQIIALPPMDPLTIKHIIISSSIFMVHASIILPIYHISPRALFVALGLISFYISRSIIYSNIIVIEGLLVGNKTIIFFLISMVLLIISILISVHNYKKREFVRG